MDWIVSSISWNTHILSITEMKRHLIFLSESKDEVAFSHWWWSFSCIFGSIHLSGKSFSIFMWFSPPSIFENAERITSITTKPRRHGSGTQTTKAKLYYFMHEIDYQNWHWVLFPFPLDFPFIRIIRLQILNLWLLFGKMHFLAAKAILIKEPYHTNPSLSFLLQCRRKLASQTKMHLVNFVGHPNFLMWHIQICSSFQNV